MNTSLLASAALVSLGGAAHCAAMCGGMSMMLGRAEASTNTSARLLPLAYHAGRVFTYSCLGLWAGAAGRGVGILLPSHMSHVLPRALMVLCLALSAIQLLVGPSWLRRLETVGIPLWRVLQPMAARLLPVRSLGSALAVGALWGYLPCGLVYAAMGLAFAASEPLAGMAVMAVFGLCTGPVFAAIHLFAKMVETRPRAYNLTLGVVLAVSCMMSGYKLMGELSPTPRACCPQADHAALVPGGFGSKFAAQATDMDDNVRQQMTSP